MNRQRKYGVCIYNGILFSFKKEGNPAICDSIDDLGGHAK
jgi:hypothetical protein